MAITAPSTFNSPVWHLQKPDGPCDMTVDYHKLNHVVAPVTAVVPKTVSLLEQVSLVSNTLYAIIDLHMG